MDKVKLLNFIGKYSLNGLCNAVKWNSASGNLLTEFSTDDKSTLGRVMIKGVNFPEGKYGIYNTKGLIKLLSALQTEIDVEVGSRGEFLKFKDEALDAKFMLANPEIIADPPSTNNIPPADFKIDINSVFIDRFIKSKAAIEESANFAFITENDKISLVINYAVHNTDRITIKTDTEYSLSSPLVFNADIFKEILLANKDCQSGDLSVSESGIMTCQFKSEEIMTKYFVVMLEQ